LGVVDLGRGHVGCWERICDRWEVALLVDGLCFAFGEGSTEKKLHVLLLFLLEDA